MSKQEFMEKVAPTIFTYAMKNTEKDYEDCCLEVAILFSRYGFILDEDEIRVIVNTVWDSAYEEVASNDR